MAAHSLPSTAKEALPPEALERIAATIAEVEEATSAEIRVSIRDEREPHERTDTIEQLAKKEFSRLAMEQTQERSGILLFILFEDKQFYVFGDVGVNQRCEPQTWTEIAEMLPQYFGKGDFEGGITNALNMIKARVHGALPRRDSDTNELTNEVTLS